MVRHLSRLHLLKFCSGCRTVTSCMLHLLKFCSGCRTVTSCYRQEWIERYGLIKMIWLCPSCRFHQNIFLERQRLLQWMWMIDRQRKHSLAIILQNNDLGLLIASLSVQLPCDQLISPFNLTKQQQDMIEEELDLLTVLQMEGVSSNNNKDFDIKQSISQLQRKKIRHYMTYVNKTNWSQRLRHSSHIPALQTLTTCWRQTRTTSMQAPLAVCTMQLCQKHRPVTCWKQTATPKLVHRHDAKCCRFARSLIKSWLAVRKEICSI